MSNSVVENLEFKDLLHMMDSRYQMFSKSGISKEIDKVLIELKALIYKKPVTVYMVSYSIYGQNE